MKGTLLTHNFVDKTDSLSGPEIVEHWRLPLGSGEYQQLTHKAQLRIDRKVATERDLFNARGTSYELPAENADGFAKLRPVASHNFRIHDYASYRGMLVMTGIDPNAKAGEHIVRSDDGKAVTFKIEIEPIGHGPWMLYKEVTVQPSETFQYEFSERFEARWIRFVSDKNCSATA